MALPVPYAPNWDPEAAGPHEVGIDAIEPARIAALAARWGEQFLGRIFTPAERTLTRDRPNSLAARFAAKEALAKSLGAPVGLHWTDARVVTNDDGRPTLEIDGTVLARANDLGVDSFHVSLSHDAGVASAVVIAEG